jgi:hypothetical protein
MYTKTLDFGSVIVYWTIMWSHIPFCHVCSCYILGLLCLSINFMWDHGLGILIVKFQMKVIC